MQWQFMLNFIAFMPAFMFNFSFSAVLYFYIPIFIYNCNCCESNIVGGEENRIFWQMWGSIFCFVLCMSKQPLLAIASKKIHTYIIQNKWTKRQKIWTERYNNKKNFSVSFLCSFSFPFLSNIHILYLWSFANCRVLNVKSEEKRFI